MCASQEVPLSAVESFFCFSPEATFFLYSSVSSLSINHHVSQSVCRSSLVSCRLQIKIDKIIVCVIWLGERSRESTTLLAKKRCERLIPRRSYVDSA